MIKNLILILLFTGIIFLYGINAQTDNLKFNRITTKVGISQGYVTCAYQDSRGFMWFGTQDGLNRYDGYTFKIYRHSANDSTSLSENWIWNIYEDKQGYIWCGTFGGGVCRFDRQKENSKLSDTFLVIRHLSVTIQYGHFMSLQMEYSG